MTISESHILTYYDNCDYWPVKGYPSRPSELNVPILTKKYLKKDAILKACENMSNNKIEIALDSDGCKTIAPVQLHESLFHFYKAFYNYLAARALYFNGLSHWIDITLYYAKFYLARSTAIFCGKDSYLVNDNNFQGFIPEIAQCLGKGKKKVPNAYKICLDIDMVNREGNLSFGTGGINSHKDVWKVYSQLPLNNLSLYSLLFGESSDLDSLTTERNRENYSFEGYWKLDFNLSSSYFTNDFQKGLPTLHKKYANILYDTDSVEILLGFSSLFRKYQKLNIDDLPIENEKFLQMIEFCLPDSQAKENLLLLCQENFPTEILNTEDGNSFYDEKHRYL
jgi:hypothetical protein